MLYFAYCTLLDEAEMLRFVPGARPRMTGTIEGWRVGFAAHSADGGGCHLFPETGHLVYGMLYDLLDEEMTQLDAISGVPIGLYRRIDVEVTTTEGVIAAVTYVIPAPVGDFQPAGNYVRPILAGARALTLPDAYVSELEATVAAARGAADS